MSKCMYKGVCMCICDLNYFCGVEHMIKKKSCCVCDFELMQSRIHIEYPEY